MQTMIPRLSDLLPPLPYLSAPPKTTARECGRPWHGKSQFPASDDFRRIDRNERFRIWAAVQAFERRTHTKGRHGGILSHSGLAVLRCLLFDFLNVTTGRLDPSYEAIAEKTNLARDTVIEAVKRLELVGILEITRRIVREHVKQWCELAGKVMWINRTRQTSNAYRVNYPLPDRQQLGDLGTPLLKGGSVGVLAESESQTETKPDSLIKSLARLDTPESEGLRMALERLGDAMGIKTKD